MRGGCSFGDIDKGSLFVMNRVTLRPTSFESVKGMMVVLSGGSNGIRFEAVERFYAAIKRMSPLGIRTKSRHSCCSTDI
jgi:hypothetical protein